MKKLIFTVGFMAVVTSTAWAQNDGFPNGGHGPGFDYYARAYAAQLAGPDYYGFDPTGHYWDYYRLDPGHGIDVDRTTPP